MPFLIHNQIQFSRLKSLTHQNDVLCYAYLFLIYQVGTKVAAVSRKTNTTTHEILGVLTKGNTQIVCHCTEFLLVLQPSKKLKPHLQLLTLAYIIIFQTFLYISRVFCVCNQRDFGYVLFLMMYGLLVFYLCCASY